jgi:hypothetical protein
MSIGLEYLTSNRQIAYPFKEDASGLSHIVDPTHGSTALLPLGFIVDAMVEVPYTVTDVYLYSIAGSGSSFTFTFTDQLGGILLAKVVSIAAWSGTFALISLQDLPNNVVIKLVVDREIALAYLAGTTADTFQDRLPFETKAVHPLTRFVQSLDLYTALPAPPEPDVPGTIVGDVILQAGYNLAAEVVDDEIDLDVVPGAGAGTTPVVDQPIPQVYRGMMQLIPDQKGNIKLQAGDDKCYAVVYDKTANIFFIHGACTACCTCDDYENAAKAMKKLLDRSAAVLHSLDAGHADYELGVTDYNSIIAPSYMYPFLKVNGSKGAP